MIARIWPHLSIFWTNLSKFVPNSRPKCVRVCASAALARNRPHLARNRSNLHQHRQLLSNLARKRLLWTELDQCFAELGQIRTDLAPKSAKRADRICQTGIWPNICRVRPHSAKIGRFGQNLSQVGMPPSATTNRRPECPRPTIWRSISAGALAAGACASLPTATVTTFPSNRALIRFRVVARLLPSHSEGWGASTRRPRPCPGCTRLRCLCFRCCVIKHRDTYLIAAILRRPMHRT